MTTTQTQQQLAAVESFLLRLLDHVARIEGERDRLVNELTELEVCSSSRFAGLRS